MVFTIFKGHSFFYFNCLLYLCILKNCLMIVENLGYLKIEQVSDMVKNHEVFSIYKTHKNTKIIVRGIVYNEIHLFYPKKDRVPYKSVEGRKITNGIKIFDSKTDVFNESDYPNQMMSYREFMINR